MIEIRNFQFGLTGSTFDVDLDGQTITACRAIDDRGKTRVLIPQSASGVEWGEHTVADIESAVTSILKF